jgi:hypothetical protein
MVGMSDDLDLWKRKIMKRCVDEMLCLLDYVDSHVILSFGPCQNKIEAKIGEGHFLLKKCRQLFGK